jgi:hypothetical protein
MQLLTSIRVLVLSFHHGGPLGAIEAQHTLDGGVLQAVQSLGETLGGLKQG